MEQNEQIDNVNIPDFDPFNLETPGKDSRFVLKIPGPEKPLICKILPDPRYGNGKSWYRPHRQFPFMIGPNPDTDTRQKTCMSFFGGSSPENDAYWEYKKKFAELKKLGKGNSIEATKLEALTKKFNPKDGGWLLIIEPESSVVKAVRVGISVLQFLTGKEATDTKPAIPSLIKKMAADGVSPFDVRQSKPKRGWIKIYKTGTGLATRYFVEPVEVDVPFEQNGRKLMAKDYAELNVHEKILGNQLTMADLPDVLDFEKKFAWTPDECQTFVNSLGTEVPERFRKKRPAEGRTDETDEAQGETKVNSIDSLPSLPGASLGDLATAPISPIEIPF